MTALRQTLEATRCARIARLALPGYGSVLGNQPIHPETDL